MNKLEKICVFCGSSEGNDLAITETSKKLGEIFAKRNITLVYGAAKIGVMGILAKSVLDNNGRVIGVIPNFLKKKEVVHLGLSELITTENMHERKLKMQEESDGFIALPGGMGTLATVGYEVQPAAGAPPSTAKLVRINANAGHIIQYALIAPPIITNPISSCGALFAR